MNDLRTAAQQALEALRLVIVDVKTTPSAYEAHRQAVVALEAALAAAPQWVSCAERLPEAGVEVLVAVGPSVYLAEREDGEWWAVDRMPSALGGVTHWMPLPAAPRSEG